jgi:hypothetical protein
MCIAPKEGLFGVRRRSLRFWGVSSETTLRFERQHLESKSGSFAPALQKRSPAHHSRALKL